VAEDNAVNVKVATRMLSKFGCRVDVAANGLEAVELYGQLPYDIVFMDCQMPEMDGFEATAEIRRLEQADGRRVPIVALTANAMAGDRERCLAAGMDDFISKPIKETDLSRAIEHWVPSRQNRAA
jgi:CheY-like chemotaxis protein